MHIADALANTPVSTVDLTRFVEVPADATVAETVRSMCSARRSCACIVEDGRLAGVFTQRDVLLRAIGRPSTWDRPIAEEMTTAVRTITVEQSVSDGLKVMNDWWVRSVPVVDNGTRLVGNLSYYIVMAAIADLVRAHAGESPAEVAVEHGLTLIDFTGLNTSHPVTVGSEDTADIAAHHMRARAIGSVLVVDEREHLIGVLSEFDLQMKVGCDQADLSTIQVKDIMTPDPVALAARSSIASAIQQMADREFSHVPLLGESGRLVGIASFRDVAAYFEASLQALS
ncbi:MAG: CBS domain-containing protein [Acidimicrobiia bacterium]|nr:CBS domain-containing protein [Acidimicrobiia bacterium]